MECIVMFALIVMFAGVIIASIRDWKRRKKHEKEIEKINKSWE